MDRTDRTRRLVLLAMLGTGAGLALRVALGQSREGIRGLRGNVRISGKRAREGDAIHPGDTVETARRSSAVFVVGQDAFLLRDSSRIEISGAEIAASVFRLVTGKLLGVFGSGRDQRLVTPTATIGIRGTGAYLEAETQRTYFCLCYGTADVATADGNARAAYTTTHHESPRYLYGDGRREAIVPATVVNHTDAELIMLEALVGRTPPPSVMDSPFRY
jgi:hypothetical protein